MKKLLGVLVFTVTTIFSINAQNLADFNRSLDSFHNTYIPTLQNATVQQNVYAKAFIGKLFPAFPPHFGIGIDGGVTRLDATELNNAASMLGFTKLTNDMIFPTFSANARIGGLFLPFDLSFSCFGFDSSKIKGIPNDFTVNWFCIGGDLRWAILDGSGLLPALSIGAGYYYTKGIIGVGNSSTASLSQETVMHTGFASIQLSKTIIFFTPYVGFRAICSKADSKITWSSASGLMNGGVRIYNGYSEKTTDFWTSIIPQVYGGFGLALGPVNLDLNGGWDFRNQIWSAGLAIRVQL
ncbi:MAG: hypothetical protein MJ169_00510 [Treponema sp.]|nr:hypothetical protein [Treponema sp.]